MELKTKIHAEEGKQDLVITREFDLPLELLFKAYEDPEIVSQWMGTNVLKLECRKHGSFQFETIDPKGNKHGFNGAIHDFIPNHKIVRTFEMETGGFGVQLEILTFETTGGQTSKLHKHVIYESAALRDENLKLPFKQGINFAHNRLQDVVSKLNEHA